MALLASGCAELHRVGASALRFRDVEGASHWD